MTAQDFGAELRTFALEAADQVGFADATSFEGAPPGTEPTDLMPECRSVVVFSMKHLDVFSTASDFDCQAYSQDITNHQVLHQAYRISRFLEKNGFHAFPMVASVEMWPFAQDREKVAGRISLRHAAQLAGLGRIGRNAILVTPELGPRVQLGAVLTDSELPADRELDEHPCTFCNRCVDACPAQAIREPEDGSVYVPTDRERCMAFRREHGGSSPLGFTNACSLCRAACPVGQKRETGKEDRQCTSSLHC